MVSYTFDDGGATFVNAPNTIDPFLSGSAWSDADGTLTSLNGVPTPGVAVAARSWHDGNNFAFTLTVAEGYRLDLDGYAFNEQASNGGQGLGPTTWTMVINGLEVGAGAANRGNPGGSHAGTLGLNGLTGAILFEIFAFGAEETSPGAGNAANASWRIDNFTLSGSVSAVPLPAAAVLFGSALCGLGAWRRRGTR